ncbi:MAG: S26 family signal peptidase [Hyphomicrobiales bacterium]
MCWGLSFLSVPLVINLPNKLIWNTSNSAPRGLYWAKNEAPSRGDIVIVRLPFYLRKQADERNYLPISLPLLKPVAALNGDKICRISKTVFINGKAAAVALQRDQKGRSLLSWSGCFQLSLHEIFLLSDYQNSFDGRYFGKINIKNIQGIAKPIWIWN